MDKDLKWNSHVEYITKKACKYIRLEYCVERGVPSQHPEDNISKYGAPSPRVCCPSLAGHSRLPL